MATKNRTTTTQWERIANVLMKNTKGAGITPAKVAQLARVSRDAVYRRVADLRSDGMQIFTNSRKVNGKKQTFYRYAGATPARKK